MEPDNNRKVLLVRMDIHSGVDHIALRDYILESLALGALILGMDDTYEIMELPPLGSVEVKPLKTESEPAPIPDSGKGEEKRAILQRLKDYRAENGLGSLEKLSAKTAHQKGKRLSAETLRFLCAGGAPKMPMTDWRKISRALDLLAQDKNRKEEEHAG